VAGARQAAGNLAPPPRAALPPLVRGFAPAGRVD